MNFFRRAMASITRKAGKTTILLLLVFVLGNVIAGAVSIEQSIRNTKDSATKGMTPVASVEIDYRKISDYESFRPISVDVIERLGSLPSVAFYDYSDSMGLQSRTLKRYYDPSLGDDYYMSPVPLSEDGTSSEYPEYFTFYGGQSGEILDRKLNKITIVEGRELNDDEVSSGKNLVVVSKNFANINNLQIGSTFSMEIEIFKYDEVSYGRDVVVVSSDTGVADTAYEEPKPEVVLTYEFTIVGFFETVKTPSSSSNSSAYDPYSYMEQERQNMMYTSNKVIRNINDTYRTEFYRVNPSYEYYGDQYYTPFYVLRSSEDLEQFRTDALGILPDTYRVVDNQASFRSIAAPLENMSSIATIVLIAGVGASLVILSLLITLLLRERRHEIGIYRSLGERKIKIIGQVLSEVLVISLIAITLALFTGNFLSGLLSNSMIENQVISQQQSAGQGMYMGYVEYSMLDSMGYGSNITLEDLASQYRVSLGPGIILTFYVVGILTVLVSTLVPILYVLRLNPRKILM